MRQLNSKHLDAAVRRDHQPGIQESGVIDAFLFHAAHHRLDHLAHDACMQFGCDYRRGGICAHAAGIGATVAIQQAFVILAGRHWQNILAIHHHDKAGFFAAKKFLDHYARTGVAKFVIREHHVDRGECFIPVHRHHDALAGGKPVGFDHDGRAMLLDIGLRRFDLAEGFEEGGGDVVPHHETLGEILGGFELRGSLGRA